MSYLIYDNQLIATTSETLKSGTTVNAAHYVSRETLNANRKFNLVNSFECKISNAKKWDRDSMLNPCIASSINDDASEFLLS